MTTNNAWNTPALTSDGQLLIGDSSSPSRPAAATLTAGANITITNGNGSISIAAIGGGGSGFQVLNRQVFTTSGTYTPTVGMIYCDIEVIGGGGGSGGLPATLVTTTSSSGGGGAGGYARGIFSAATIGVSQVVTVGAAGAAGAAGTNPGGTGGTTSVGILISSTGGIGGAGATATSPGTSGFALGGAGGSGTGGDFQTTGQGGRQGTSLGGPPTMDVPGDAGSSFFGGGGRGGFASTSYGGGGGGVTQGSGVFPAAPGLAGFAGVVIATEYIGTGATIQNITYLTVLNSPYAVLTSDVFLSVDCSGGPVILEFPDTPQPGQGWTVKDSTGSASGGNPITLTTVSGITLIDGMTSQQITTAYQANGLIGTNIPTYEIY